MYSERKKKLHLKYSISETQTFLLFQLMNERVENRIKIEKEIKSRHIMELSID